VRPLFRWTSLAAGLAALGVAGHRRLHLHDFDAFLALLFAVAALIVAVFLATRGADEGPAAPDAPS
jgi:hypothetical protein